MRLSRYLFWMGAFLAVVAGLGAWLSVRLQAAFLANPYLNGFLVAVWLIGIAYIVVQAVRLGPEIAWVRAVQRSRLAVNELEPPTLMGSLARLMEDRATPLSLTPTALRSVLDGIAVRLDESREIARYLIGLMIFLGLLGTFWGLLRTVSSVGGVVSSLSITADPTQLFQTLKSGLEGPLTGMGTAFSSSLLGLAGSLVLGFLDLQLGRAQNRFFIDLEDWLFSSARGDRGLGEDGSPAPYLQALIEQTADTIDRLHRIMAAAEDGRRQTAQAIQALAQGVGQLTEAQRGQQAQLARSADSDAALMRLLGRLEQIAGAGELGGGDAARGYLRSIEAGVQRIADDQNQGRTLLLQELKGEIRLLTRTIGAAALRNAGGAS
jgi:hypothetical protein